MFLYSLFTLLTPIVVCVAQLQENFKKKKKSNQAWEMHNPYSFSFDQYFYFC